MSTPRVGSAPPPFIPDSGVPKPLVPIDLGDEAVDHLLGDRGALVDPDFTSVELDVGRFRAPLELTHVDPTYFPEVRLLNALPDDGADELGLTFEHSRRVDSSDRGDEEARALHFKTEVELGYAFETRGVETISSLLGEGADVYGDADRIYGQVLSEIDQLEATGTALGETLSLLEASPTDLSLLGDAVNLGASLEAQLDASQGTLDDARRLFDDVDHLVDRLGKGHYPVGAATVLRGFAEQSVGLRSRSLRIGQAQRLDAALSVGVVTPLPLGSIVESRLKGLALPVELRSSLIAVRAYVDVTVAGLEALRASTEEAQAQLEALSASVDQAADTVHAANQDPLSILGDPEAVSDAANVAEDIEAKGAALSQTLETLSAGLAIELETGVEVIQATTPGIGVDQLAVRWRFDPQKNFEAAVTAHLDRPLGLMGAERTRLSPKGESYALEVLSTDTINGYNTFFPRTAGLDVDLGLASGARNATNVAFGVATGEGAVEAHLGVAESFGPHHVRLGVVDADLGSGPTHSLEAIAAVELATGSGRRGVVGLSASLQSQVGDDSQATGATVRLSIARRSPAKATSGD